MWHRLFDGPQDWTAALLTAAGVLLLAALTAKLLTHLIMKALDALAGDSLEARALLAQGPARVISTLTTTLMVVLLARPAAELAGLQPRPRPRSMQALITWIFESGIKALIIALVAYLLVRTTALLVKRFESTLKSRAARDEFERLQRARTLGSIVNKLFGTVIAIAAGLMILRQFGLDITPLLTGAGIAGLAIGFGAQTLVKDLISGFFLILEDQIRVGDAAELNGISGTVEQVNLRTIVLRDIEGTVHVVPNGAIETLANSSRDYSYYVIDLNVSYREDPDKVIEIMNDVSTDLRRDPELAPFILGPVEAFGVDAFTDRAATMRFRIKTVPLKQWQVGRRFRKRLMQAIGQGSIEMPAPGRLLI